MSPRRQSSVDPDDLQALVGRRVRVGRYAGVLESIRPTSPPTVVLRRPGGWGRIAIRLVGIEVVPEDEPEVAPPEAESGSEDAPGAPPEGP